LVENKNTLILHIAREPHTGVWTLIKELSAWQSDQADIDSQVVIFSPKNLYNYYKQGSLASNVKIHFFPISDFRFSYWFLLFDNRLRRYIYKNPEFKKYKRIILQFHNANLSGLFLPIKPRYNLNIKSIVLFHGTPLVFPKPGKLKLKIHQLVGKRLKYADRIVSVSEKGVDEVIRIFSCNPKLITVIPNGIADPGIIHRSNKTYNQEKPFIIGFVGSLTIGKRWDLVIDAARFLIKKGFPIKVIIAGSGPGEATIKAIAQDNQNWIEYRGYVQEAARTLIPEFDVLILPSSYEGTPMTIIEAMACGVPVISTSISDIPQMIDGELKAGYLISQDTTEIAKSIEKLITNKDIYTLFSYNSRQQFYRNYTIDICGSRYLQLYTELFISK